MLLVVFLAALESEKFFTLEPDKQLPWLRRVAHNKVIDYHRGSARRCGGRRSQACRNTW